MAESSERTFRSPKCCECGKAIDAAPASYETKLRLYCDECAPVRDMKEHWKPFVGAGSAQVWVVKENPFKRT